jgi:hypothetical protein
MLEETAVQMDVKELIAKYSDDSLSEQTGMVYQVWNDGEITLQKSGRLLWHRTLHCMMPGNPNVAVPAEIFPHVSSRGYGYAFVDNDGATEISRAILGY